MKSLVFLCQIVLVLIHANADEEVVSVEDVKVEDDVVYITPKQDPDVFFAEHFDSEENFNKKWIKSQVSEKQQLKNDSIIETFFLREIILGQERRC